MIMNHKSDLIVDSDLQELINELSYHFMNISDYHSSIDSELIVKKKLFEDDEKFQLNYPDHPLAIDNRIIRIRAADNILKIAHVMKKPFKPYILNQIHIYMFDCCAAVRLSLTEALEFAGDITSIEYLSQLAITENESNMVKDQIVKSISVLLKHRL